jgi:hypothetical protein
MQALAALALTMVAWPVHHPLTLLPLIPVLWLILMMMKEKRAVNKMKTPSEASRRPPQLIFGA